MNSYRAWFHNTSAMISTQSEKTIASVINATNPLAASHRFVRLKMKAIIQPKIATASSTVRSWT